MKKGIFTIAILAISVINLIFNIVIVFTMLPGVSKTNKLVTKITNLVDLDGNQVNTDEQGEIPLDKLEGLSYEATVTLSTTSDSTKFRYAKVTAYISLNTTISDYKDKKKVFESNESITVSILNKVISKYNAYEILDNKDKIRSEVLLKLQQKFGETFVYDVSFSEFNVQ